MEMKYFTFVTLTCASSVLSLSSSSNGKITDLKSLSMPEKLKLFALLTIQPYKYGDIFWTSVFVEEDLAYIDYFFIDVRSLLTQSKKVEQVPFPELDWSYDVTWCIPSCYEYNFILRTGNTTMTGQQQTTSVNEVTPTTFRNLFTVPSFVWESLDFMFEVIDGPTDIRIVWRNMRLSINNLKLDTTFDYEFMQDLGIQISNLDIKFSVGHFRSTIWDVKQYMSEGDPGIPFPPLYTDWTIYLLSGWVNHKQEYLNSLQSRINCVLSESRVDPGGCGNKTSEFDAMYKKMSVVQLFETIGLGSLDRT